MHRRPEFSFPPGSPARGPDRPRARPPVNAVPPRPAEEEEVRWLQASRQGSPDYSSYHYHDSSGTPSPQLWEQPHRTYYYQASAGSSPSRAQAIAGYRREMLDLVRGLPESAYELSLRDIVEHRHRNHPSSSSSSSSPPPPLSSAPLPTPPPPIPALPPSPPAPRSDADVTARRDREPATAEQSSAESKKKKQGRTKQRAAAVRRQRSRSMERSVSLDTGLLIKFFMPLSIGGRGGTGKKKVSPKPDAANKNKKKQGTKKSEEARLKKKQDEEWWSKSEFSEASAGSSGSRRTSSTGSSNSSNGSVGNGAGNGGNGSNPRAPPLRSRSRKRNGCYAFLRAYKSKNGVSQD